MKRLSLILHPQNLPLQRLLSKKISFECTICKASVMAHNGNDAIRKFADNPWLHKTTCEKYKPKP